MDPPLSTVHYFTGAKNFTIHSGRFRTITGNSYTNCYPPPPPASASESPPLARPGVVVKTSFFAGASDFEIGGGEFSVIDGDAVDLGPAFGGMGMVDLGVGEDEEDGLGGDGSAPQIMGVQRTPYDLDVLQDMPPWHGQLEDTGQRIDEPRSWPLIASAENHEDEIASTDVPTDEDAKPPPTQGTKIKPLWRMCSGRLLLCKLLMWFNAALNWTRRSLRPSRDGLCAWVRAAFQLGASLV
ncbi:hypothetical protein BJ912DRAFT_479030 [Pholiota molesta]|nr:hypothetical protein BJ912DRAFT_479030 [Pholiota molesta]